ncbi:MAG: cation:proton antiporter subunit C [Oscillospiraceae bacterium]|nr:cation:proton antiporter subunit C [Oscillospiraceae bacterium]
MGPNLLSNYFETASMILFGIGFTTLFLQPNLIKKVIGLNIMDSAVYLFLASKGYIEGRLAPIVVNGVTEMEAYINPIPAGLVLTGIVVGVSVTAVSLSLIQKLYKEYHTLDMDEIMTMVRKESDR